MPTAQKIIRLTLFSKTKFEWCIKTDGFQNGKFLRWHVCRANVGTKSFFGAAKFLTKNAPKVSPKSFSGRLFVDPKKSLKTPTKFPVTFTRKKSQQLQKGVFGKGSFRNLCAELCFVFFCVLRRFSPANLTEISFRNCHSNAGIFWKTPSRKPQNAAADKRAITNVQTGLVLFFLVSFILVSLN